MIVEVVLGFVGLVLIGIAYFLWMRTKELLAQARRVKGTVIGLVSDSEGEFAPVFKFTASNGDVIEKHETVYSKLPSHKAGEIIDILYGQNNPQAVRLVKTSSLYFAPILLVVMGIIFLGSGAVMLGLGLLDVFFWKER